MPAKSTLTEDHYYLWVCLRLLVAKTGEQPPWEHVAQAMGSTKKHTMYTRYNSLCKNPPQAGFDKAIPDLKEVLDRMPSKPVAGAKNKGRTGGGRGGSRANKATLKAEDDEPEEIPQVPKHQKRKSEDMSSPRSRKKQRGDPAEERDVEEEDDGGQALANVLFTTHAHLDSDVDAPGETDEEAY